MKYHMCICSKNHLEAVFRPHLASGGLRFEKSFSLALKYENIAELFVISKK